MDSEKTLGWALTIYLCMSLGRNLIGPVQSDIINVGDELVLAIFFIGWYIARVINGK